MTISDQIRKQLEQPDGLTVEAIEPLADEYGQQTRKVNARLSECTGLLRKGLRSEAIQRASMKPSLLEWCAQLDFPEFEEWMEILKFYGISIPPLLDREAAHQLQEAIVDVQPLEELLRQHRRLAIAKAPLAWRLKVLRQLAKVDSVNALWVEDQKQWEAVRLKQIPTELNKAIESGTVSELQELAIELNNSEWVVPRPTELCKRAASASAKFVYKQQVVQLQSIADQFHAAYSEGDQSSAELSLRAWNDFLPRMVSSPPDDLVQSVEPAIEWINGILRERELAEEHERASSALEELLLRKTSIGNLQRRHYDIMSLQAGIDPILDQRYQTRIAEMKQADRRKTQMTYISIFAVAITTVLIFGLWFWRVESNQNLKSIVANIAQFTKEGKFMEGTKYVEGLDDSTKDSPEVRAAILDMQSAENSETTRSKEFWDFAKEVDNSDSSKIVPDAVNRLEGMAKKDAEVQEVEKIKSKRSKYLTDQVTEQSYKVESDRKKKLTKLSELRQFPDDQDKVNKLKELRSELDDLLNGYPRATDKVKAPVKGLIGEVDSEIDNVLKSVEDSKSRAGIFTDLRRAESESSVDTLMEKFVANFPIDQLSKDFSKVLEEAKFRKPIDNWNLLCTEFGVLDHKIKPHRVRDLNGKLLKVGQELESLPGQKTLEGKVLNAVSQIDRRDESLENLRKFFQVQKEAGIGTLVTLVDTIGKPPQNGKRSFMIYKTWKEDSEKIRQAIQGKMDLSIVVELPIATDIKARFAPFYVHQEPKDTIDQLNVELKSKKEILDDWDVRMNQLMNLVAEQKDLDRQLKESLIGTILSTVREGSYFLKDSFEPLDKHLTKLAEQDWLDQKDVNWELDAKYAQLKTSCLEKTAKEVKAWNECLSELRKSKYEWIGLSLPVSENQISSLEPHICINSFSDGFLFAVEPVTNEYKKGRLVEVGKLTDKKARFYPEKQKSMLAGRLIYWSPVSQATKK